MPEVTTPRLGKALGDSIRKARTELADPTRTQDEVAAALKVQPETISMWEGGHRVPEFGNLVRLAAFLGVSLVILLAVVDETFVTGRK